MIVRRTRGGQDGWALLGLILTLTIMSIMLVGIVPSVQMEVRRDKEDEMIYRGQEMAEGIARYYNIGRLGPIALSVPPPYGYLYDLSKLKEGETIGVTEIKFVRPSATVDPMVNKDWVPVRARDPRLMKALQAYAAANLVSIPPNYLILAAAPLKGSFLNDANGQSTPAPGVLQAPQAGMGQGQVSDGSAESGAAGASGQAIQPGLQGQPGQGLPGQGVPRVRPTPNANGDDDDDDDDDDDTADPLSHLVKGGDSSKLPIVGVAPNLKGRAVHLLWGMQNYDDWVFIYIPPQVLLNTPALSQPINPQTGNQSLTIPNRNIPTEPQ